MNIRYRFVIWCIGHLFIRCHHDWPSLSPRFTARRVSNHQPLDRLSSSLFTLKLKRSINGTSHWPFVRAINRWPIETPPKGPVMGKTLQYDNVIMNIHLRNHLGVFVGCAPADTILQTIMEYPCDSNGITRSTWLCRVRQTRRENTSQNVQINYILNITWVHFS